MERRTLVAVVLSIVVVISFQLWMTKNYPARQTATSTQAEVAQPRPQEIPAGPTDEFLPPDEEEHIVETDRFILTFSNIGGAIKRVGLKEFSDRETNEPPTLVDIEDPRFYVGAFSLADIGAIDRAAYQIKRYGDSVQFTYTGPDLAIEKRYRVPNNNDYIELQIITKNISGREIETYSRIMAGSNIDASGAMAQRYINVSAKVDGKILRDRRNSTRTGDVSWVALNSKYFSILLRPYQLGRKAFTLLVEKNNIAGGVESAPFIIPSERESIQRYLFYIGPLDANRIKLLDAGLEDAVNYGIFDGISKVLLGTLRFFHKVVRNWGFAIICLTILVNVILYPLTRKSYKSMKAMQDLQPHIDKLRNSHKDNPQKMNRELMELYRKYKVNPLGGCLPMLFQMPIFIALYHALMRSIELRGANFLWIKDLSKPDGVPLPFSLPIIGNSINILPILMMLAMIAQQKISTHTTSEMSDQQRQQQQMMLMMPVVFVIIFYALPSGLVLYWLVNTVLMMVHQYHIKRSPATVT